MLTIIMFAIGLAIGCIIGLVGMQRVSDRLESEYARPTTGHFGDVHCYSCDALLGYSVDRPDSPPFCRTCEAGDTTGDCTSCRDKQVCWDANGEYECVYAPQGDSGYLSGCMGDNR